MSASVTFPVADPNITRAVTEIFERVLEQSPIDKDVDFFEIGGSSMSAISLILEIEKLVGRELSIATIYNTPTIRTMSALLSQDQSEDVSPIIVLRDGYEQNALFLVHGLGGTAVELRQLARLITGNMKVYGVQAKGLDGQTPNGSVEAMAETYTEQLIRLQPDGPFFLAGYSLGGLIIFEMAKCLRRRGREVKFLGMIDSYPDEGLTLARSIVMMRFALSVPRGERVIAVRRLTESFLFRLGSKLGFETTARHADEPALPKAIVNVKTMSKQALHRYRPSAFPCDVTFFQAATRIVTFPPDPEPIWRPLVGRLTVEKVPGDHFSLMKTHVEDLANALTRHIMAASASI